MSSHACEVMVSNFLVIHKILNCCLKWFDEIS